VCFVGGPKDLRVLRNCRCDKSRLRVWDVNEAA